MKYGWKPGAVVGGRALLTRFQDFERIPAHMDVTQSGPASRLRIYCNARQDAWNERCGIKSAATAARISIC